MPAISQTLLWTALPNGTKPGHPHTLRLSVFISPRLSAPSSPRPELHLFPDFLDWPATNVSFKVTIGGKNAGPVAVTSPAPRSDLWTALFTAKTYVKPYDSKSLNGNKFHSYPAWWVRQFHASTYAHFAKASPTDWPSFDDLFSNPPAPYGKLPFNQDLAERAREVIESAYSSRKGSRFGALIPAGSPEPLTDLTQAQLFLAPLTVAKNPHYKDLKPTPKPSIDFHRMVSMLGEYPLLLRLFGIVYDLEVPLPGGLSPSVEVSVVPKWSPKLAATTNFEPTTGATMTGPQPFLPTPRGSDPEIFRGLLRLSDPAPTGGQPAFPVIELEMDGSTLKTLNFAQGIYRAARGPSYTTQPENFALPALRSAGLSLAHTGQALDFGQTMSDTDSMNSAVDTSSPVSLAAEDVTRGFRIDVWDDRTNRWHQLCARTAAPKPGGYAIGSAPHTVVVPVPAGDEGWVSLGVASGPQGGSSDTYVPETILRWKGWSLVAPRPGKHLSDKPADGLQPDGNNPPNGEFPLQVAYAAEPGTLPVLRYGRAYRFRARAVDLAGNSVPFHSAPTPFSFQWSTGPKVPFRYGRLEPVISPPLIPHEPRTVGEHLERIVIRSEFWDSPDSSVSPSMRHVTPPSTTEEMAEEHGVLDLPSGRPDPSLYSEIASRAGLTYATPSVVSSLGGLPDPNGFDQPYYPVDELAVPYLPDVFARGAALQGLPGGPTLLRIPFAAGSWPNVRSFRLVVKAGAGAPTLPTAANGHALTVFAPKATFQPVRLSCFLKLADLRSLGLWEWLEEQGLATAGLAALAASGRHWMFTPYRELVIVHAVRQPLRRPRFTHPVISREIGKTFALLSDKIDVDTRSSIKLDILSQWDDPYDDGVNPKGSVLVHHNSPVGEIPLPLEVPPLNAIHTPSPGLRHDFGDTKHRIVFYEAQATTRFLEYFVKTKKITLHGTAPTVVHAGGLATGATTVKSAGTPAVTYTPTVDYLEDDKAGTIARTPTSTIPLKAGKAEVDVSFVPPPVIRTSLENPLKPATTAGYPLSIPSSARPAAPDVRYVLPVFSWATVSKATKVSSLRKGNALRVYLGRPWWSSGAGELLGVVIYPVPIGAAGYPAGLEPFVTRYGRDPLKVTNPVKSVPTTKDFALRKAVGTGIQLVEAAAIGPGLLVDIVGHEVGFDVDHQLWYCDIEIDTSTPNPNSPAPGADVFSYWPFVRLALVRYQPGSLKGVEVSRVVQADFVQIAPNRVATLTFPSATTVHVTVTGYGYSEGQVEDFGDEVAVTVEEEIHGVTDPDLRWTAVSSPVLLTSTFIGAEELSWTGKVTLPAARGSRPFRIRIEEREIYVGPGGTFAPNYVPRVTYLDTLEI
jgi:hypothetical protein